MIILLIHRLDYSLLWERSDDLYLHEGDKTIEDAYLYRDNQELISFIL